MGDHRLFFAESVAREAGQIAQRMRNHSNGLSVQSKGPQDFVTAADLAVESFIRDAISKTYPEDGILGEEGGTTGDLTRCWIIDPIDGTSNFMRGLPDWAVSIGYFNGREFSHGVIYAPDLNILASAVIDEPAKMNGRPIQTSTCFDLEKSLIILGFSDRYDRSVHLNLIDRLLGAGCDYRKQGAATLGLLSIAAGRAEAYYEPSIHVWDVAAGTAIVRAAGGIVLHPEIPSFFNEPGDVLVANQNAAKLNIICRNEAENR